MIVVLEGPDGAGKSTLAQTLKNAKIPGWRPQYFHVGPPSAEQLKGQDALLRHYGSILELLGRGKSAIFDRLAYGERVYGPIFRGRDALGDLGWKVFKRLLTATDAVQILCLPPYEVAKATWASGREELLKKEEQFLASYRAYMNAPETWDFVYDYTKPDALPDLLKLLTERQQNPRKTLPPGAVGNPNATFLFVGDQSASDLDLPFFATGASSAYLHLALWEAGYGEHELAFTNAYTTRGQQRLIPWDHRKIITLGDRALKACNAQGIPVHGRMTHPAYWRRFHTHERRQYVLDLLALRVA